MNKTPDPGEVVRDKVIPAAEEIVAALAERVGPYVKEAADRVAPLTHQAVEAVAPYAQQVSDAVAPYAQQAADKVGPLTHQAAEAVAPYVALVREQGLKSSHDLADRFEPALQSARGAAKDAYAGAREKVTSEYAPAVGAAAATAAASAAPLVSAASDRGRSLIEGVRKEPVVVAPPKKRRGWLGTLAIVAAAAGATYVLVRKLAGDKGSQWQTARPTTPYEPPVSAEAGVAEPKPETAGSGETDVVASTTSLYGTVGTPSGSTGSTGSAEDVDGSAIAARQANLDDVASTDEGTDAPSAPTGSTDAGSTGDEDVDGGAGGGAGSGAGTGSGAGAGSGAGGDDRGGSPYADEKVETELETVEERAYEEPSDAVWAEQDSKLGGGPDAHPERYDMAGAYVGVEPPEGYLIKGNERSMKYHLPDSNSYNRTIAEVWFVSEEAAQAAGFSRAQH